MAVLAILVRKLDVFTGFACAADGLGAAGWAVL
jgi:hypothetical protein